MAKETVLIIDYGAGNIRSAAKAFEHVIAQEERDGEVLVSGDAADVARATRIVLPGQGAFGDCIAALRATENMVSALEESVLQNKTPFLGICVGMQLLVTKGFEHGEHTGLGWLEGEVIPMQPTDKALKIPHMGWNDVSFDGQPHFVLRNTKSATESSADYYFVHSFMVKCKDEQDILAVTEYGGPVVAAIGRKNIIGVQFHPEKSQDSGLKLISNFMSWAP